MENVNERRIFSLGVGELSEQQMTATYIDFSRNPSSTPTFLIPCHSGGEEVKSWMTSDGGNII